MPRLRPLVPAAAVFALLLAFAAQPAAAAGGFFEGVDDLPLMPGLTQSRDGALVFESPFGRIVEVYATGAATRGAVLDFYADTLPQLGWQALGDGRFRREDETLALDFPAAGGGPVTLRITLTPAGAPPR